VLLVIDNYDSFVYNLVQYFGKLGEEIKVIRNDQASLETIAGMKPKKIVISPGPGRPENAGVCLEVIKYFRDKVPILGVCLGHQCIGFAYGAKVVRADEIIHGKTSVITHTGQGIFANIPQNIAVTRYHSLIIKKDCIPQELIVTASTEDGKVMAVKHAEYPTFGVQFHPESIASQYGLEMLQNFVEY